MEVAEAEEEAGRDLAAGAAERAAVQARVGAAAPTAAEICGMRGRPRVVVEEAGVSAAASRAAPAVAEAWAAEVDLAAVEV